MPNLHDIQNQINSAKEAGQDKIRRAYVKQLSDYTERDTIVYASAFSSNKAQSIPGAMMSVTLQDVQGFMSVVYGLKNDKLDLILHSPGGSMETADQIVQYLRSKYKHIRAIVPQNAMSAATMIACACDEIVMGKHSAIGPIDPQVTFPTTTGQFTAPAQSILDEFEQAKREIAGDPSTAVLWATKVKEYPHGFLTLCQTTLKQSVQKVEEWLDMYMFANSADKKGAEIASCLGDASIHKTHGRPITIRMATDKGLNVIELESDPQLQDKVLSVFHATMVTFQVTNCVKMLENQNGAGSYLNVNIQ